MALSAAAAKRQRQELLRDIARELKAKDRARLGALRDRVRALRRERKDAIATAIRTCRARRTLPTLAQLRAQLRADRAAAKDACEKDKRAARRLGDAVAIAREERNAERAYQAQMRRLARQHGARERERLSRRGPSVSRAPRDETDDQVEGNIPPELVALWRKVRRQIHGSDRMSRTEAFLHYAEEHPDEQWTALEGSIDRAIADLERRQAMPNPKRKKNASKTKRRSKTKRESPALQRARAEARRWRHKADKLARKVAKREHKKRPNPHRPPRRWFDRCLASVTARRYARDPAAVCGAAWWRKPARERERIVRRLERGSPRDRRAAVAIAKAEQRRADRGPPRRKQNGGMGDGCAAAEYERTHWGQRGRDRVSVGRAADPRYGTATKMGRLVSVVYETQKGGDREPTEYEHAFEGRRPDLLYNAGGLLIAGGDYTIEEGGIKG